MNHSAPRPVGPVHVDVARQEDVAHIRGMVVAAYTKYIERIGRPPAPMAADYEGLVAQGKIFVLRGRGGLLGSILIDRDGDAVIVGNLCVAPAAQGKGYGRMLMDYAETVALANRLAAITLYANEKMHENIALYSKLGFVETGRGTEGGYARVYFRKDLTSA